MDTYTGTDYLADLLGIPRVEADQLVSVARAQSRKTDGRKVPRPCGVILGVGPTDNFACQKYLGHAGEHDWEWMLT